MILASSRVVGLALVALGFGLGTAALAQQGPLPVDVATPKQATVTEWDEYTGRFEAVQRAEMRARVTGYLEAIDFRDGELVEEGQVLFRIDPSPFEAVFDQAQAELQSARAQQTLADSELRRGEQLVQRRTVSVSTLDELRAAKLSADAQVAVATAALRAAELDLEFTEVKAPFTGRVSDARVDRGNLVLEGETVLGTLVSTGRIHLVFTASEADFLKYSRLNQSGDRPSSRDTANPVQARLIDEDGWPHRGRMDFVANELDPNAGTITGRAVFDNPDDLLTPGLFARLRLIGSGEYDALLIPDAAILSDQARKIVLVVDDAGTVAAKPVEPGPLFRGLRVIRGGLDAGDRVIVAGLQRARPGGQVVPEETAIDFLEPATD